MRDAHGVEAERVLLGADSVSQSWTDQEAVPASICVSRNTRSSRRDAMVTEIARNDGTSYNVAASNLASDGTVIAKIGSGVTQKE